MAAYNTASDSENTAVRALITKVGDYYLDHLFNIGSGQGGMSLATQLDVSSRPKADTRLEHLSFLKVAVIVWNVSFMLAVK